MLWNSIYYIGGPDNGFPTRGNVIDILEVGVGGGSIAWLDDTYLDGRKDGDTYMGWRLHLGMHQNDGEAALTRLIDRLRYIDSLGPSSATHNPGERGKMKGQRDRLIDAKKRDDRDTTDAELNAILVPLRDKVADFKDRTNVSYIHILPLVHRIGVRLFVQAGLEVSAAVL